MKKNRDLLLQKMLASGNNRKYSENVIQQIKVEFESLLLMLAWLNEMMDKKELSVEEARIHIDIQKNTMRTRLMGLPGISLLEAEHLINEGVDAIRSEIYSEVRNVII